MSDTFLRINHLDRLPAELLIMTMENMANVTAVMDFVKAFPRAYEVFIIFYKRIIISLLDNDMPFEIKAIFKCIIAVRTLGMSSSDG